MKPLYYITLLVFILACNNLPDSTEKLSDNPFLVDLNVPVDYANVSAINIEEYANYTFEEVIADIESIKNP